MAKALGLDVKDTFPIPYKIDPWVSGGAAESVLGKVDAEPVERLSRVELINLAV